MAESAAGDTSLRARRVQQQAAAAPAAPKKPDAKAEGTEAGGVEGFVTFEMTPEAEAEHEWWIYWFCFVGASLLGVMCMALAFCSAALSPVRCPPPTGTPTGPAPSSPPPPRRAWRQRAGSRSADAAPSGVR